MASPYFKTCIACGVPFEVVDYRDECKLYSFCHQCSYDYIQAEIDRETEEVDGSDEDSL